MNLSILALAGALTLAPAGDGKAAEKLPPGAVSRLGTLDFAQDYRVGSVEFSKDGKYLLTTGVFAFHIWETKTGKQVARVDFSELLKDNAPPRRFGGSRVVRFSESENVVLGATGDGYFIWDVEKQKLTHFQDAGGSVATFSQNAKWACVTEHTDDFKQKAVVWNIAKKQRVGAQIMHNQRTAGPIAVSEDGARILIQDLGGQSGVWDATTGKLVSETAAQGQSRPMLFSLDGKSVFGFARNKRFLDELVLWDAGDLTKQKLVTNARVVSSTPLAMSRDGKWLAFEELYATVIWDLENDKKIHRLRSKSHQAFAFSPDKTKFATGEGHTVNVWDLKTGDLLTPRPQHRFAVIDVTFAPDGKSIITFADDHRIIRWLRNGAIESARTLSSWNSPTKRTFSRSGSTLAVDNGLQSIDIRKLPDFQLAKTIELPEDETDSQSLRALTLSPDAKTLAVGILIEPADVKKKPGVSIRLYETTSGKQIKEFDADLNEIHQLRFSPDGKGLLIHGGRFKKANDQNSEMQHKLSFFDLGAGNSRFTADFDGYYFGNLQEFLKDGSSFASLEDYGRVYLRDAKTGTSIRTLHDGKKQWATALAIGPRTGVMALAVGDHQPFIEIWDLKANKKLHTFQGGHRGAIKCLAFSDDEESLLSGSSDTTAIVWDFAGIVK